MSEKTNYSKYFKTEGEFTSFALVASLKVISNCISDYVNYSIAINKGVKTRIEYREYIDAREFIFLGGLDFWCQAALDNSVVAESIQRLCENRILSGKKINKNNAGKIIMAVSNMYLKDKKLDEEKINE